MTINNHSYDFREEKDYPDSHGKVMFATKVEFLF